MSKSSPVVAATATEVRAFVSALVESGEVTLTGAPLHNLSSRGRLHPEVIAAHNSRVTRARRYAEGNRKHITITYKHTQPSGRSVKKVVALPEAEVRVLAGALAGKRGPLSGAAKVAAGEAFAARQ